MDIVICDRCHSPLTEAEAMGNLYLGRRPTYLCSACDKLCLDALSDAKKKEIDKIEHEAQRSFMCGVLYAAYGGHYGGFLHDSPPGVVGKEYIDGIKWANQHILDREECYVMLKFWWTHHFTPPLPPEKVSFWRKYLNIPYDERLDQIGRRCDECEGVYVETSVEDDFHGTLHCNICNLEINRYARIPKRK